jgi:hypothetical protein
MLKNVESACPPRAKPQPPVEASIGNFPIGVESLFTRSSRNSERESKASDNSLRM